MLSPWDYTAGCVIILEAGGIVKTLEPYELTYSKQIPLIAGNKHNIDDIIKIVKG